MDDKSFIIRVPKRRARMAMIVGITALIVAPLTAIGSHSFSDVPDSNTFHSDIEWMEASGVTKGCNPPANTEYCPDDNVTRGQMAAFMNRLAGYIGATDGTPAQADNADTADSATSATNADNADTVDGNHAADLRTTLDGLNRNSEAVNTIPIPSSGDVTLLEKTLSNSDGEFAFISYGFHGGDTSGATNRLAAWIQVDNTDCTLSASTTQIQDGSLVIASPPANEFTSMAGSIVVPTAGDPTITLCGRAVSGTAEAYDAHLNTVQTDTGSISVEATSASQGVELSSVLGLED